MKQIGKLAMEIPGSPSGHHFYTAVFLGSSEMGRPIKRPPYDFKRREPREGATVPDTPAEAEDRAKKIAEWLRTNKVTRCKTMGWTDPT